MVKLTGIAKFHNLECATIQTGGQARCSCGMMTEVPRDSLAYTTPYTINVTLDDDSDHYLITFKPRGQMGRYVASVHDTNGDLKDEVFGESLEAAKYNVRRYYPNARVAHSEGEDDSI